MFHLSQSRILLGLIPLGADVGDLDLQLVVAAVDELDALFAALVLLVLAVQHFIHGGQLTVQGALPQLVVLDGQDQHAAKIHQRADAVAHHIGAGLAQKQQVAHRKDGARHHKGHESRLVADGQPARRAGAAAFQPEHAAVQRPVKGDEQPHRQRVGAASVGEQPAVELPLGAGGQLCQNKRPGADIEGLQQGDGPGAPQIKIEQRHGQQHTGHPPAQRHRSRLVQKEAERRRPQGRDARRGLGLEPQRQRLRVQQHRQHFGQRRVQAGNVRQVCHAPSPPM